VKAQYVWDPDNSSYAGTFYTGSTAVTKVTDNLTKTLLNAPTLAAIVGDDGRATPYVELRYNSSTISAELVGDITPAVYRAEVIVKNGNSSSGNTGTTIAGWAGVTTTWKKTTTQNDGSELTSSYVYYGEDTGVEKGKTYVYVLSLTTTGQQTRPSIAVPISVPEVLPKAPTVTGLSAQVVDRLKSDGSPDTPVNAIAVSWQGDATSTYKLYRAPNVGEDDTSGNRKPGEWTEITLGTSNKDDLNRYSLLDTASTLAPRNSYFYKVVATSAAADGAIEYTGQAFVNSTGTIYAKGSASIASGTISFAVSGNSPGTSTAIGNGEIYFYLTAQQGTNATLFADTEEIRVYYAPVESGIQLDKASYVTISKANAESASASDREKKGSVVRGRFYIWAAYIKLTDGTLVEVSGVGGTTTSATP
jgi:hypothetical protein